MNEYHGRGRLALAAHLLLVACGALAGFALVSSTSRYIGSERALAGFEATTSAFRLIDDGVPRAELKVRLANPSSISITVLRFTAALTLNEQNVGSTQGTLPAGVAPADATAYHAQANVDRAIGLASPWEEQIVIYLDPVVMQTLRAQGSDAVWKAEIGLFIILPFSQAHDHLVRSVSLQEVKP